MLTVSLTGHRPRLRGVRHWLAPLLMLLLSGCAAVPPTIESPAVGNEGPPSDLARVPPTPAADAPVAGGVMEARQEPGAYLYSHDPERLASEVAGVCARAQSERHDRVLRTLVADLYFSEVHPAAATEALLAGDCGSAAEIVEEMVARGGSESREAVLGRARLILGAKAARRLESAAAAGLARQAGVAAEVKADDSSNDASGYGMLYFPSAGGGGKLVTAMALNRLYEEALPGYGIYTFVLIGSGFQRPGSGDVARYSELFRMIETYVQTVEEASETPSPEEHVFLVPIKPGLADAPLIDQSASDLSELMRRHFTQHLRHAGHGRLAGRLERGAGPFLVAALEPRLLPSSTSSPRLVADLSGIGPEHIYGIVDAFDRAIAPESSGRPESLTLIRKRLLGLPAGSASGQGAQSWVFVLGPLAANPVAPRSSLS